MISHKLIQLEEFLEFDNEELNLQILSEECAEVTQLVSKSYRFGLGSCPPDGELTNRQLLEQEIGHVIAMMDILTANGTLSEEAIIIAARNKVDKLRGFYDVPKIR